jgi:hypothetical protein
MESGTEDSITNESGTTSRDSESDTTSLGTMEAGAISESSARSSTMESAGVNRESESVEVRHAEECDEQDDKLDFDVDEQLDLNVQQSEEDDELDVDEQY